jgi:predicted dehydrogenase
LKSKKHVLIDKPVATTLNEGRRIQSLAKKEGLLVAVNFPLRVNPVTNILKINLKNIGKLKKVQVFVSHGPIRTRWQSDMKLSNGGVILDLGSHYFDLISFLTGFQPKTVINTYSEKLKNEDSGFINLDYNDFSSSIILLRNQKLKKSIITCAGSNGFVFADYTERKVIVSNNHEVQEIECSVSNDFEIIISNLVRSIHRKENIIADANAGILSLKTVLSIYDRIRP